MLKVEPNIADTDYYIRQNQLEQSENLNNDGTYYKKEGTSQWTCLKYNRKEGEVKEDDYKKYVDGKDFNGMEKGKNVDSNNYDLTFSAPKDFSILMTIADDETKKQLEEIMNRANQKGLEKANEFIYYRKSVNGKEMRIYNAINEVATFKHDFSREEDMQKHDHNIVNNRVYDPKTKQYYRAEFDLLMKNQHEPGLVFQAELAKGLKELGFEIEPSKDNDFSFSIKGISKEVKEEFSKRHKQIIDEFKTAKEEGREVSKSVISLQTRKKKGILDYDKLTTQHKQQLKEMGLDEKAVQKMKTNKNQEERKFSPEEVIKMAQYRKNKQILTKKDINQEMEHLSIFGKVDKKEVENYTKSNAKEIKKNLFLFKKDRELDKHFDLPNLRELFKGDKKEFDKIKEFSQKRDKYFEKKGKQEERKAKINSPKQENTPKQKQQKKEKTANLGKNGGANKAGNESELRNQIADLKKSIESLMHQLADPELSFDEKVKIYAQISALAEQGISLYNQLGNQEQQQKNDYVNLNENDEKEPNVEKKLKKMQEYENQKMKQNYQIQEQEQEQEAGQKQEQSNENKTEIKTEVKAEAKMEMAVPGGMSL